MHAWYLGLVANYIFQLLFVQSCFWWLYAYAELRRGREGGVMAPQKSELQLVYTIHDQKIYAFS